jgi:hypothetical protein
MKLVEMKSVAADTLAYFVRIMPDTPFTVDDIVIEFAPSAKMAERARALCAQYSPDKTINASQARELNRTIAANALIGKEKSVVIARIDYKRSVQEWREIFFHELIHKRIIVDFSHLKDEWQNGFLYFTSLFSGIISAWLSRYDQDPTTINLLSDIEDDQNEWYKLDSIINHHIDCLSFSSEIFKYIHLMLVTFIVLLKNQGMVVFGWKLYTSVELDTRRRRGWTPAAAKLDSRGGRIG